MFLKVSCPFFCVYALKEFSFVSNLIFRLLNLNKCVIFNIFLRGILLHFIRKVEIVTILDSESVLFFFNVGFFSSATHIGLF